MAATKYTPRHFAGKLVQDAPTVVFTPSSDPLVLDEILTGVILCNHDNADREFSMHYVHEATSIYLFKQLLLPAHSTTNLDLYLPLSAGMNLLAVGSVDEVISLTLYGLRMEEV